MEEGRDRFVLDAQGVEVSWVPAVVASLRTLSRRR
jgi:hypothetical protein